MPTDCLSGKINVLAAVVAGARLICPGLIRAPYPIGSARAGLDDVTSSVEPAIRVMSILSIMMGAGSLDLIDWCKMVAWVCG